MQGALPPKNHSVLLDVYPFTIIGNKCWGHKTDCKTQLRMQNVKGVQNDWAPLFGWSAALLLCWALVRAKIHLFMLKSPN